jgi:hypothetical protein
VLPEAVKCIDKLGLGIRKPNLIVKGNWRVGSSKDHQPNLPGRCSPTHARRGDATICSP